MACVGTAGLMLLSKIVAHTRDYLKRRFARGELRPVKQRQKLDESGVPLTSTMSKSLGASMTGTMSTSLKNLEEVRAPTALLLQYLPSLLVPGPCD